MSLTERRRGLMETASSNESHFAKIDNWEIVTGEYTHTGQSATHEINITTGIQDGTLVSFCGYIIGTFDDLPDFSEYGATADVTGWICVKHTQFPGANTINPQVFMRKNDNTNAYYSSGTTITMSSTGILTVKSTQSAVTFLPGTRYKYYVVYKV